MSGRQGIRTLISHERRAALAVRSGQPYPATFRICQWTHRESNPDFQSAGLVSSRWTMSPLFVEWTAGESNPDLLLAGQTSSRWTSSPFDHQRSVRELNPVFLTEEACSGTPTDQHQ